MSWRHTILRWIMGLFLAVVATGSAVAETNNTPSPSNRGHTVAVLPFAVDEKLLNETGRDLQTLLSAHLSSQYGLALVERAQLAEALSEVELGMSGTVDPTSASKVGFITGADILVTGRAFPVQKELVIVAKVIGVETSRTFGQTVTMPLRGSLVEASTQLADKIAQSIGQNGQSLVAREEPEGDAITRLRPLVKGLVLPSVSVSIPEMSMDRQVLDPAAETEIGFILQGPGFEIIDPLASNKSADIEVLGEAFSEFGLRRGELVSSKGRVEIKAIARESGRVVLIDRETATAVDLSPEIAGKAAIAKGAANLAERLVPAILAEYKE